MMLIKIQKNCEKLLTEKSFNLPLPSAMPGFCTESFIWSICSKLPERSPFNELEALSKKIEVSRRLCISYDERIEKVIDNTPVSSIFVDALAAVFLYFGTKEKQWKWINTVLKLEWGILQQPEFVMSDELKAHLFALMEGDA